jgi:hypothetical protein
MVAIVGLMLTGYCQRNPWKGRTSPVSVIAGSVGEKGW